MKKYLFIFLVFSLFIIPNISFGEEATLTSVNVCVDLTKNLRYKMRDTSTSKDITNLQAFLKNKNYITVLPTGYFGVATLKGVKDFQRINNITPTGFVGSLTRAKIKEITCGAINNVDATTTTTTDNTNTTTTEQNTNQPIIENPAQNQTQVDEILTAPNNSSLKVRTEGVVSLTNNSATLRGYITAGARSATKSWFEITKNPSVYKASETTASTKVLQRTNDKFDQTFLNLNGGTTYYYRACAENTDLGQKSCGTTSTFTTPN